MATVTAPHETASAGVNDVYSQPLSKETAEQLGIPYDPANPPTMASQLQAQMLQSMRRFSADSEARAEEVSKFRRKLTGQTDSPLSKEQQRDLDALAKVIGDHPALLKPTYIYAATLLRRKQENEALLDAVNNPIEQMSLYDDLQGLLRSKIPQAAWPEFKAEAENKEKFVVYVADTLGAEVPAVRAVVESHWADIRLFTPEIGVEKVKEWLDEKPAQQK